MDVGGWLRGIGLGQYEANFRDNKIDADLLPRLTDAVLKDIGVSAAGNRLRLLDAIAALAGAKLLVRVFAAREHQMVVLMVHPLRHHSNKAEAV